MWMVLKFQSKFELLPVSAISGFLCCAATKAQKEKRKMAASMFWGWLQHLELSLYLNSIFTRGAHRVCELNQGFNVSVSLIY